MEAWCAIPHKRCAHSRTTRAHHNPICVQVREEDVFKGVDASVKNFLTSVPLVADLRSPAMRDRHWEQLMATTKVRAWVSCRAL